MKWRCGTGILACVVLVRKLVENGLNHRGKNAYTTVEARIINKYPQPCFEHVCARGTVTLYAMTYKSLFVCTLRRFFASVGQTIGFGFSSSALPRAETHENDGLTIRVCGEAALCHDTASQGFSAQAGRG